MRKVRNSDPFRMGAARRLRKTMTKGERIVWSALRRNALGYRVRRQYSAGDYVLDFYIHAARLCIEVDGPEHSAEHDHIRDAALGEIGIRTIRIPWSDLPHRVGFWINEIKTLVAVRAALQPSRDVDDWHGLA